METQQILDSVEFKDKKDDEDMGSIHILLFMVLVDMAVWHHHKGYTMTVTDLISTLEEDIALGRESDAHRTRRGADLRSRHMEPEDRKAFMDFFNNKYREIASISRSDLVPRIVVEHGEGDNRHFHVALHFKYRITE